MRILREIIETPWFYWSFGVIGGLVLVYALVEGVAPGQALVVAVINAFFWAFTVSGVRRIFRRMRDRWP